MRAFQLATERAVRELVYRAGHTSFRGSARTFDSRTSAAPKRPPAIAFVTAKGANPSRSRARQNRGSTERRIDSGRLERTVLAALAGPTRRSTGRPAMARDGVGGGGNGSGLSVYEPGPGMAETKFPGRI